MYIVLELQFDCNFERVVEDCLHMSIPQENIIIILSLLNTSLLGHYIMIYGSHDNCGNTSYVHSIFSCFYDHCALMLFLMRIRWMFRAH